MATLRLLPLIIHELINYSNKITEYQERLRWITDMNDKRNYNPELAEKIRIKVSELQDKYFAIKDSLGI